MKRINMLAVTLAITLGVVAQNQKGTFSIRPMAGISIANLSSSLDDYYHNQVGLTAGIEVEYAVSNQAGISLGAIYSQQGSEIDGSTDLRYTDDNGQQHAEYSEYKGHLRANYINLPLMVNYYIPVVRGLAIKAGIQVGLRSDERLKADQLSVRHAYLPSSDVFTMQPSGLVAEMWSMVFNETDVSKSVDFGIPVGLSYEYKNVTLDARYCFGLTKTDKILEAEDNRNRTFSVTLGYRFNL
jgi:opacity protein-like surface antigen